MRRIRSVWLCGLGVMVLLVAACNGGVAEPDTQDAEPAAEPDEPDDEPDERRDEAGLDLASVCPDPIVIQNRWIPQATEGHFYNLIPLEEAEFDPDSMNVTGPAAADPNVTIEIRAGGPAVGFQSVSSLLYANPETLLSLAETDELISVSAEFPGIQVFNVNTKHPRALNFGVDAFPEGIETFDDVRESGATVLVSEQSPYALALIGLGALDEDQVDFSFDFSPARFIAEDGRLFQAAFGTLDAIGLEQTVEAWGGRAVGTIFAEDGGYPNSRGVFTRPEVVEERADCLNELVPLLQQSWIDYHGDPGALNQAIADWNDMAGQFAWPAEAADQSVLADLEAGLVGNGPGGYIGEFEPEKVRTTFDLVLPIFEEMGAQIDPELTPEDLYTNEFLDPSIALPEG